MRVNVLTLSLSIAAMLASAAAPAYERLDAGFLDVYYVPRAEFEIGSSTVAARYSARDAIDAVPDGRAIREAELAGGARKLAIRS